MSREFYGLLKKEWAERRSMFWLGMLFMVGVLGYCIAYETEYQTRAFIAGFYHTCTTYGQLAAVLMAMTTATGEYTQRTLKFSAIRATPPSKRPWRSRRL